VNDQTTSEKMLNAFAAKHHVAQAVKDYYMEGYYAAWNRHMDLDRYSSPQNHEEVTREVSRRYGLETGATPIFLAKPF